MIHKSPLTVCLQGCNLDPNDISVLAGAGSVLDCLFQLLVGPGDACLIPAPYYPAFDNDLQVGVSSPGAWGRCCGRVEGADRGFGG